MKTRLLFSAIAAAAFLTACGGGSNNGPAVPTGPATNPDGSVVTQVIAAQFNASEGMLPFPINLLLSGTTDLTLNVPVADPTDFGDPAVALSALDGFSTTERWVVSFIDQDEEAASIDPASVVPGGSVRVFQVTPAALGSIAPGGIVREMTPGVDFVATAITPSVVGIIWLRPLDELTMYMAVLTNGITDTEGNAATPDQQYFIAKRTTPLIDADGNSTEPLLDDATAAALEPLRQLTNANEAVAAAAGIDPADIIVSYTVSTQSITPVTKLVRSVAQPGATTVAPTGLNTSVIGAPGIADIFVGIITMPYYLGVPSAGNPTAPLTEFWTAEPGAYIPPFDGLGLDPTSTNITVANPFPVVTDMQTVPMLVTVPNANSGQMKPGAGWPTVIFQHAITGNRTQALAIADAFASIGYATVAIDLPLHGIVPEVEPSLAPFYIENTPFAPVANERNFGVDYVNNATGAPGPDGVPDASGTHYINLQSLLTSRDNLRQSQVDLSILALSIPGIDLDGDSVPDMDGSNIGFSGLTLGAMHGVPFLTVEPTVNRGALSAPGGGIARLLNGSEVFGPRIRAGLAAAGVEPGTPEFEQFLTIAQTVVDSADPINWIEEAAEFNAIVLHEIIDDSIIPNSVPTAPLSGTEPLIAVGDLNAYDMTISDSAGVRAAGRFLPPATTGSLLSPATSPAATFEMQSQFASFIATFGTTVVVSDPSVMAPAE